MPKLLPSHVNDSPSHGRNEMWSVYGRDPAGGKEFICHKEDILFHPSHSSWNYATYPISFVTHILNAWIVLYQRKIRCATCLVYILKLGWFVTDMMISFSSKEIYHFKIFQSFRVLEQKKRLTPWPDIKCKLRPVYLLNTWDITWIDKECRKTKCQFVIYHRRNLASPHNFSLQGALLWKKNFQTMHHPSPRLKTCATFIAVLFWSDLPRRHFLL